MKKAKVIRKKVLWFHSRLEEELGIKLEVERVKPRLYQLTHRSNGICMGYTQLQIGIFLGEDIPFCESNGFFLGKEVDLVKNLIRCDYEMEFPHRDVVRVEKVVRQWRKELEQRLREIKKRALMGGVQNVFGKRKGEQQQKVGKLNRRGGDKQATERVAPKSKGGKNKSGRRVPNPSKPKDKRRGSKGNSPVTRTVKSKKGKNNGQKKV